MHNEKIAKELLAETKTPQEAYEYAIRREKGIEHSRQMKTNPFGNQNATTKQEPVHYIKHGDEEISQTIKQPKEAAENFDGVHILEVNKIHAVSPNNNNKEINILTPKSNATNVVT